MAWVHCTLEWSRGSCAVSWFTILVSFLFILVIHQSKHAMLEWIATYVLKYYPHKCFQTRPTLVISPTTHVLSLIMYVDYYAPSVMHEGNWHFKVWKKVQVFSYQPPTNFYCFAVCQGTLVRSDAVFVINMLHRLPINCVYYNDALVNSTCQFKYHRDRAVLAPFVTLTIGTQFQTSHTVADCFEPFYLFVWQSFVR